MKTFFKWLKDGNADRTVVQDVKSFGGWMQKSGEQILESNLISNEECQLLLNMQRYLFRFPEVDNEKFLEMLRFDHQELETYRPLVQEVSSRVNIAEHLREHTWLILANEIANDRFTEIEKSKPKQKREIIKEIL